MVATRNHKSLIAEVVGKTGGDLSSVALNGQNSTVAGVINAQQRTSEKLDLIQDAKLEICKQLSGPNASDPSLSARHAIPEAENRFAKDFLIDGAMAGVGFLAAGPAGVAVAGAIGAIRSAASLMTTPSAQHQGTIHFGESGVQGGELNNPIVSSTDRGAKQPEKYVDVMGGVQGAGVGYKAQPAGPQPMLAANSPFFEPHGNQQQLDLSAAVAEELPHYDMKQIMAELGGNSEAEKRLTNDLGYQEQLMRSGFLDQLSPDGTLAQRDAFDAKFAGFKPKNPVARVAPVSAPRMA